MEPIMTSGYNYQRIDALEAKVNELIDCLRQGMELVDIRAIAEVCEGVVSRSDADRERRAEPQELARNQPCGCVICVCGHDDQCQGCGAKHCGTHPVGQIPNPVYVTPQPGDPDATEGQDDA